MQSAGTISVSVNGEPKEVAIGATVRELLDVLGIRAARVAVERNLQILPRAAWGTTQVSAGDRFEIVQFVGGG